MADENLITVFAKTNFRNKEVPFGIKTDDRRRHMYVIGKTGMGKTTLMENMVIQDIRNGHGVAFLDPHGDSVQKILNCIPNNRVNDVIYFNPADMEHPIAFNILEAVDPKYKHLVASGLMGVFTKIWANLWSARMEYILNNTIMALLDSPGNTMLGITRMYVDKKYRKKIVDNIKDPMVRAFWVDEFANYNEKYRTEAIAPIQNKVGQFLSNSIIRNIVGQPKSTIDLREIMDNQKILIMDLSKGKVGEDNSALLGAMLVTKLQLAAMSRTDIPEKERKDFYMYVDEFQNFATESFATILSEARKYRLALIVGHQYIAQLEQDKNTKVRDAIFGNVGTMVVFRVGAADAEYMETEFDPTFTPTDLVNLPKYSIILKLMINGVASEPFSAATLPPHPDWYVGGAEKVIKVSRERYSNTASEVEQKIERWMSTDSEQDKSVMLGRDLDAKAVAGETEMEPTFEPAQKITQPAMSMPVPKPVARPMEALQDPVENFTAPIATQPIFELAPKRETVLSTPIEEPVAQLSFSQEPEIQRPPVVKQTAPVVERPMPQVRQPTREPSRNRDEGGRTRGGDRDRHSYNQRSGRGDRRAQPQRSNRPEQKKHNPIWDTVATLHTEKVNQQQKTLTKVVSEIINNQPSVRPEKKPEIPELRFEDNTPEQPPVRQTVPTPAPTPVQERHVLQPGQSQKF